MKFVQRALRVAVPVVTGVIVIEAIVSVAARWPSQFGGHGHRDQVLAEFAGSSGTALAPPLLLLLILAVIAVALQRPNRWLTVATVILIPVAAVLTVGALGEAAAASTPDVPRAAQVIGGTIGALLSLTLLTLAVAALIGHRRPRRASGGPRGTIIGS